MKKDAANNENATVYFYIRKDGKVWVENPATKSYKDEKEEPYFLAVVTKCDENKKEAEVKYISTNRATEVIKFEKTMPFLNETSINVTDMAAVEDINEVDLLNNLKNRFFKKGIFTNVGSTLIIVNPYQRIEGAFGENEIENFLKYFSKVNVDDRKEIENPHLYDLTLTAIKHLNDTKKNQAIVISGESGAGKTETAKNAMKCITYYFGKNDTHEKSDKQSLEDQILGCNPILEAFGNAKTIRNDNSSRFGKYVTINLDINTGRIEGAQINTYLLEKSRVCEPAEGERNYHIFYHLLKGAGRDLLNELYLTSDPSAYKFLSLSKCYEVDTVNDVNLYKETMEAFKITGFSDDEIKTILKVIAACLLLGNLTFKEVNACSCIDDSDLFTKICSLLGCQSELLEIAFTKKVLVIDKDVIKNPLKLAESLTFRNVFTKELYNRVFNWIVRKLNKQLAPHINMNDPNKKYIGLLDIFGFECFDLNSLEQLCINFTNEKLQQLYINDIFKAEQIEFVREGLKDYLGEISFKDNQSVIDLMDKSGTGFFQMLDDACIQNKDDKAFFTNITKAHQTNPVLKIAKFALNKFTIIHTAKDVEYTSNGFVMKNLDEVKKTMTDTMMNSQNAILKYIFTNVLDEAEFQKEMQVLEEEKANKTFKREAKYLGTKFRSEMIRLMTELSACECHYVRCLKPNEIKKKEFFVPTFVFQQIRYLGILDTIRVRKDGYPSRKKFKDFFFRFEDVCWFQDKKSYFEYKQISDDNAFKDLAIKCLDYIAPKKTIRECLVGLNKIFMKQRFYSDLEKFRAEKMKKKEDSALMINKFWTCSKKRKWFLDFKKKAKYLQEFYRTKKYYIKTQKLRSKTKKIQSTFRAFLMNRTYKFMLVCIYKLQTVIKSFLIRQRVKKMQQAGVFLNRYFKLFLIKARSARHRKMNMVVNKIVDRAWKYILKKYQFFASIKIQSHVRRFLTRIKNWDKVEKGRKKREFFLHNKAATQIQKNYKGFRIRKVLRIAQEAADKIQGHWKMQKYIVLMGEMRSRTLIIQRNVRIYLLRKHVIDSRLEEHFEEENLLIDKLILDTTQTLFPNVESVLETESDFFEDEIDQQIKKFQKKQYKAVLPEYDPMGEPKISAFAKIVDMDTIIDTNEIYDQLWAKEFEKIFNMNMANKSPLQLIHTGGCHTVAVNSKGKLFSWGWNNYGQCGRPLYSSFTNFLISEIKRDKKGNIPAVPIVNYLPAGKSITCEEIGNVKQVLCGEDHTFVIDENGNAFGFGSNEQGQLGLGNNWEVEKPSLISELKGRVKEIKTAGDLSIAMTNDNELYVWPYGNGKPNLRPLRLFIDKKILIQTISCGKNFAIILSKQGILYSFGKSNKKGELGLGDNKPRNVPEPIYALADTGEKISQVSCGFKHTVAKNPNGKVFTWGNNSDGQLGTENYSDSDSPALVEFNNISPHRIKIVQVSAGFRCTFFLTESRQIITCGTNGTFMRTNAPVKFDLKIKTPEIADDSSFSVVRIQSTWNRAFSVFYCTICDMRHLTTKLKNKQKLCSIANTLAAKWETDSIDAPYIEPIAGFFNSTFMKKAKEEKKLERKNVTMMKQYMKKMI